MNKKHSVSSLIAMLYFLYVMFFMKTISIARTIGILNNENKLINLIPQIQGDNFSTPQVIFYFAFLGFICFAIINEGRDLDICEDENKIRIVNEKLLRYKFFITINIIFTVYLIVNKFTVELLNACILLNITTVFICYGKSLYFKSYIFNRKLDWLKKTSQIDVNENVDTKWWRKKIWFNNREKVPFKYRINNIIISSFTLFISTFLFLLLILSKSFISILFLYFIINHMIIIIESIFGLYTMTSGKCSGILEKSRNKKIASLEPLGIPFSFTSEKLYYQIVLTDFNKKREIAIISDESCGLSEMDTMGAVHGIFSKQTITINMIPTKRVNRNKILFSFITRFAVISIILYKSYTVLINYKEYSSSYTYNSDYNYEEDDPYLNSQKEENIVDILPKDKKYYNKIITLNEEKSSENVNLKLEKLYFGKDKSKLQFRMCNKSDVPLVLNVPYETHIFDKDSNQNSNILMPGEEYYIEMDIWEKYNNLRYLNINLEYTLSHYVNQEYGDFFYYLYYPLNVVDLIVMLILI